MHRSVNDSVSFSALSSVVAYFVNTGERERKGIIASRQDSTTVNFCLRCLLTIFKLGVTKIRKMTKTAKFFPPKFIAANDSVFVISNGLVFFLHSSYLALYSHKITL